MSGAFARQYPEYAKCPVLIRLDHFSPHERECGGGPANSADVT